MSAKTQDEKGLCAHYFFFPIFPCQLWPRGYLDRRQCLLERCLPGLWWAWDSFSPKGQ